MIPEHWLDRYIYGFVMLQLTGLCSCHIDNFETTWYQSETSLFLHWIKKNVPDIKIMLTIHLLALESIKYHLLFIDNKKLCKQGVWTMRQHKYVSKTFIYTMCMV